MLKNKLKKSKISKKKLNYKSDKLKAEKLIKFLNSTIKTSFSFNKYKNNLSKIALNTHYKWDSLSHVKLLNEIEKKYKISINEKNINQFSNLKLILNYLSKNKLLK